MTILVVGLLLATAWMRHASGATSYPVDVRVASVRMTAAQVEAIIDPRLQQMQQEATQNLSVTPGIDEMVVLPLGDVQTLQPNAGAPDPGTAEASSTVWYVKAHGTFISLRVPPGGKPTMNTTGYFLIDDQTGSIVGFGMPAAP